MKSFGLALPILLMAMPAAARTRAATIPLVSIPAGRYWIGCDTSRDASCSDAEKPGAFVNVRAFRIGKYEVTQRDYQSCIKSKACTRPAGNFEPATRAAYPVTEVTWYQARQFCRWIGMHLPTEIEWEVTAKGAGTRIYPWGDARPDCKTANSLYMCKARVKPVGSVARDTSPLGAHDLNGNVEEWTSDWYDPELFRHLASGSLGWAGPRTEKSVRGGSYRSDAWHSRNTFRFYALPSAASPERGFRCATGDRGQ